jgi:hypothetical protein
MIAAMNKTRSNIRASTLCGKIYITGGLNGEKHLHSAGINQRTFTEQMLFGRSGVS